MTFFRPAASIFALTLAFGAPAFAQTATDAPAADAAAPVEASPAAEAPAADAGAPATDAAAPADAAVTAAAPTADAAASGDISGTYTFDPEHSQVVFSYDHAGLSTSHGFVNGVNGIVTLDKANPENSTVEASFPVSAITTIAPALDKHLLSDDLFKGQTPETLVTFKSTSVKVDEDGDEAEVVGDLTLNGVTKPVTLEVEMNMAGAHPVTGKPAVGFDIDAKIKRSDFNLGLFVPAVSDEVEIEIAVEAAK